MEECKFPDGIVIKPDGVNELDPCIYETKRVYTNCIVEISECKNCGKMNISWCRTPNTKKLEGDVQLIEMVLRGEIDPKELD